ncbi:hypothetical protein PG984_005574 [Apiospora sp. TS-2023a]
MYPRSIACVVAAAVLAVSAAETTSSSQAGPTSTQTSTASAATPKITSAPEEMSGECETEVFSEFEQYKNQPSLALGDLITKSDLFASANFPTRECDLLSKIPATLHEEYFTFESQRSEWWKTRRTAFSKWASTCTGTFATTAGPGNGPFVTPYMEHSAFLDTYDPASFTSCKGVTRGPPANTAITTSSEGAAPRQTMAAGAALAAAAGPALLRHDEVGVAGMVRDDGGQAREVVRFKIGL